MARPAAAPGARTDPMLALAAPGLLYMTLIFALPLGALLVKSFFDEKGQLSLSGYAEFLGDPYHLRILWRTVRVALLTTLLALLLAYPTAYVLSRARGWVQGLILCALVLPLAVGVVVKAFAWSILFRTDGAINKLLIASGLIENPVRMLFTEPALIIGAANVFLPFMVLPIYAVLRQLNPSLPEAASSLGANPWFQFSRVTLPLTMPGIIAGCAFVFSMAVSMYVIPSLIVGERSQTVSMLIARSYLFLRDEQLGSAMSAVLLAIAIAVVLGSSWLIRRYSVSRP